MSLFSRLFNKKTDIEQIILEEKIDVPKIIKEIEFESDHIESLIEDDFVDASDPLNIAKYKSNLRILERQVLDSKEYKKMFILRNDDFLPPDWIWRVNSADTTIEKINLNLSYELRKSIACANINKGKEKPYGIDLPVLNSDLFNELSKMDKTIGNVYLPVKFRSTKHFTVNTALGCTGEYNTVESDRTFTVIDCIDNFLDSGYAYSISHRDAYLDITHKGLEISNNAVILIEKDKYEALRSNEVLFNQLSERRVITFKGDINLAVNMYLTEQGVLPYRAGQVSVRYQDETYDIMDNAFKTLSQQKNIYYDKGHGNIDGHGGHFSDLFDGLNYEFFEYKTRLAEYLNNYLNLSFKFTNITIDRAELIDKCIREVGVDELLEAINSFNNIMKLEYPERYKKYVEDRKNLTVENDLICQQALKNITAFYENTSSYGFSIDDVGYVNNLIKVFFHSNKVEKQVEAALEINKLLSIEKENSYTYNN